MDPVAALKELDHAMNHNEREEIAAHASDLIEWLEKGGARPVGKEDAAYDWRGTLTTKQLISHLRVIRRLASMN